VLGEGEGGKNRPLPDVLLAGGACGRKRRKGVSRKRKGRKGARMCGKSGIVSIERMVRKKKRE